VPKSRLLIVSPATARENNGNWQTASRWAHFLRDAYDVTIAPAWNASEIAPDLMIALHARRSAAALAAFVAAHPERPRVLVMTGTDLYRDIDHVPEAQASLGLASAIVVLQEAGLARLPAAARPRARVIYQSAPALRPHRPAATPRSIDFCMIGHLRPEKDPVTYMRAAPLLNAAKARLLHIGGALDPALGALAAATCAANANYTWLGAMGHGDTRQRLKRCHAMVIASRMEGGANVVIEAVTSGVPVLASDIEGNRGMLGSDYAGYFSVGDAQALARLIDRSIEDAPFYAQLRAQCARRAALFSPAAEQAAVRNLVDNLLS
jgi:putative glycosyltransferase (TIGR04348 family)